jgi:hypothetical protein
MAFTMNIDPPNPSTNKPSEGQYSEVEPGQSQRVVDNTPEDVMAQGVSVTVAERLAVVT